MLNNGLDRMFEWVEERIEGVRNHASLRIPSVSV